MQNDLIHPKELVLAEWQRTVFFRKRITGDGQHLGDLYPGNQNVKPKIRQQLQFLRDCGFIDFVSRGNYRLRS